MLKYENKNRQIESILCVLIATQHKSFLLPLIAIETIWDSETLSHNKKSDYLAEMQTKVNFPSNKCSVALSKEKIKFVFA